MSVMELPHSSKSAFTPSPHSAMNVVQAARTINKLMGTGGHMNDAGKLRTTATCPAVALHASGI
jgi:hypothetical protein